VEAQWSRAGDSFFSVRLYPGTLRDGDLTFSASTVGSPRNRRGRSPRIRRPEHRRQCGLPAASVGTIPNGNGVAAECGGHPAWPARHVDEIAATCLFLASDDAGFITGQTIHVNGGAGYY
jgi:NAD(P)-dependent dehydrogenase (short-subunit alcohol dehydrogenase family)